jgi:hypothetical protein
MAQWNKDYNPQLIAKQLEKSKSIDKDGTVTFHGFAHTHDTVLLNTMLSFHSEVPELERRRIINAVTFQAGKKGIITAEALLLEINEMEKNYLAKKPIKFVLVTSISFSHSCVLPKLCYRGANIIFEPHLKNTFVASRNKILLRR